MMEIWNDDTKTTGEKILALVSTVGMLIPLLVRVVKNFVEIGVSGAAAAGGITATGAAAGAATGPTIGFGTALATATWQLTLIAAVIGGVIVAVKALSDAFKQAKPQSIRNIVDEYNDYKTAAESLRGKLLETREEARTLQEQFDTYGSVVDALEQCTKGTDDWY